MKLTKLCFFTLIIGLVGCSTSQEQLLPTSNSTIKDIWQNNGGNSQVAIIEARDILQPSRTLDTHIDNSNEIISYTRTAENEATNLFPRLPNPNLVMYIFPHLSQTDEPIPIPGYTTVFPFYGRVQYAQPGERTNNY